jgi:hypothetical protein
MSGRGATSGPDLSAARGLGSPAALIAALWNHILLTAGGPQELAIPWPSISAVDVADLAAFFQSTARRR